MMFVIARMIKYLIANANFNTTKNDKSIRKIQYLFCMQGHVCSCQPESAPHCILCSCYRCVCATQINYGIILQSDSDLVEVAKKAAAKEVEKADEAVVAAKKDAETARKKMQTAEQKVAAAERNAAKARDVVKDLQAPAETVSMKRPAAALEAAGMKRQKKK